MTAYSIIRIKKLKSWGAVAGAVAHNARTRETLNADPAAPCRFLIGSPSDDPVALCKARLGGNKYVLSQLQSDYANAVAHLGLTRGREGSKAKHTEVAEYYANTQSVEHTAMPQLPSLEDIQPPEPSGTVARMKSENLIIYAKEAVVKAIKDQMLKLSPVLTALTKQNDLLTTENARLRQEREQLKDVNSRISRKNPRRNIDDNSGHQSFKWNGNRPLKRQLQASQKGCPHCGRPLRQHLDDRMTLCIVDGHSGKISAENFSCIFPRMCYDKKSHSAYLL